MKEVHGLFYRSRVIIIGAIVLTATLGSAPLYAKSRITSTIDAEPTAKLTAEESQAVSVAAGRILKHVNEARVALEDKKRGRLWNTLKKG